MESYTHTGAIEASNCWHKGPGTALADFGRSGKYKPRKHLQYLSEIEQSLHPEAFNLFGKVTSNQREQLEKLIQYFIKAGEAAGIVTAWTIRPDLDYMVPSVHLFKQMEVAI